MRRLVGTVSAVALLVLCWAAQLSAQGITGAAVRGTVADDGGQPVSGAVITLVNTSTGQRLESRSRSNGSFNFENAPVGGPYTLSARSIGYQPVSQTEIHLTLGQAVSLPLRLDRQAVQLEAITVTGQELQNPIMSSSHTGAASIVTSDRLAGLPSLSRNFTDFIATVPQVVGTSISGQNNRFNNIQIDGGVNNDLFGLAGSGTPGGQAGAKPISLEAVREYQVLIAPFDVRQGGFTGGLVNAVTKAGTNTFRGGMFAYYQDEAFVGKDTAGAKFADFSYLQYGLNAGGPIVRDKLHFFFSTDLQSQSRPFTGNTIRGLNDSAGVGITGATADRVRAIMQAQYGFDPGDWQAPVQQIPDRNGFLKLTGQLGNGHIEVSHNWVNASSDVLARGNPPTISTTSLSSTGYQLSNSGYKQANTTNTTRAKWTASFGGASNELLVARSAIRDHRDIANRAPHIFVGGENPTRFISVGGEPSSQANLLNQDIFEVTDNLTASLGSHRLTVGTHNEFFKFHNVFQQGKIGIWHFADTTALKAGTPNRYVRTVPGNATLRPEGATADFSVRQVGGYIQDQWSPLKELTVTVGVRADVPLIDEPVSNPALQAALQINNADFPTGKVLFSPRLGFNYDVSSGRTVVRGGAGLFAGRPPYVWVSNAFVNTGLEQATLTCTGATIPAFTVDPDNQPTTCGAGATPPTPGIVYYDPGFKFPQTLRGAFGFDQRLVAGFTGTLDFVYTKWVNELYIDDSNLVGVQGTQTGEGGRSRYGTFTAAGAATALRRTTSFAEVLRHFNKNGGQSWSLTFQVQRQVGRVRLNLGYTRSSTEDLMSLTSSVANSNFQFATLDGTLAERNLRTSSFDVPDKVSASGVFQLPFQIDVGIFYIGRSGSPYGYTVNGDVNADGKSGNDMIYVPRDQADISLFPTAQVPNPWGLLDAYITNEPCLNEQRGRLMERNSCRNPWTNTLNARITKKIGLMMGHQIELAADFFNFLVLTTRSTSGFEGFNLLSLCTATSCPGGATVRYDNTLQRGVYTLGSLTAFNQAQIGPSRWRIQFGAKYTF